MHDYNQVCCVHIFEEPNFQIRKCAQKNKAEELIQAELDVFEEEPGRVPEEILNVRNGGRVVQNPREMESIRQAKVLCTSPLTISMKLKSLLYMH